MEILNFVFLYTTVLLLFLGKGEVSKDWRLTIVYYIAAFLFCVLGVAMFGLDSRPRLPLWLNIGLVLIALASVPVVTRWSFCDKHPVWVCVFFALMVVMVGYNVGLLFKYMLSWR